MLKVLFFRMSLGVVVIHSINITDTKAFELKDYKGKIRPYMVRFLGKDLTNKLIGSEVVSKKTTYHFNMPKIKNFKKDAKDINSLNKDAKLLKQGEAFFRLSDKEKRVFRVTFLKSLYLATVESSAKEEDIIGWLNILEQGGDREAVYRGIVLGSVYKSLESFSTSSSKELVEFVSFYASKFLNKSYNTDSMIKLGPYSLKRVIVEETLDLVDNLAASAQNVHAWYAIFSKDLAMRYPEALSTKLRGSESDVYHHKWAQKVPFQEIKSEIIIKLHLVMNTHIKESI